MKISVISLYFPPEKGAAASRMEKMCNALDDAGHDVEVLTALPNYPNGAIYGAYRRKLYHRELINGVKTTRLWIYASNSKSAIPRIMNMVSFAISIFVYLPWFIARRPDVMIVNSPPLPAGFSAAVVGKMVGARVVLNISDIWPLSAYEMGAISKGRLYGVLEFVEKMMYSLADAALTQSEETAIHVRSVAPGIPLSVYRNLAPDRHNQITDRSKKSGSAKIIYAGLLGFAQGMLALCEEINFRSLSCELHIYGDGGERKEIESLIKSCDRGIYLHSMVPPDELESILPEFHASLVPLKTEIYGALPSKIFQAISHGLPILYSGSGEGREIVCDNSIGWACDSSDYSHMARNISSLVHMDTADYRNIVARIRELAEGEYEYEANKLNMIEFIGSVVNLKE